VSASFLEKNGRPAVRERTMVWDLVMLVAMVAAWIYAIRWAVRADRNSRSSARVVEEAERVLSEAVRPVRDR